MKHCMPLLALCCHSRCLHSANLSAGERERRHECQRSRAVNEKNLKKKKTAVTNRKRSCRTHKEGESNTPYSPSHEATEREGQPTLRSHSSGEDGGAGMVVTELHEGRRGKEKKKRTAWKRRCPASVAFFLAQPSQ